MTDGTSSAGLVWLVKYYGWKVIGGVLAVALLFMVMWPKTAKEGATRIGATVLGSMLFGGTAVDAVRHYVSWLPLDTVEAQMPIFVAAGLPAWWVLGWIVRWMESRRDKDAGKVIAELKGQK